MKRFMYLAMALVMILGVMAGCTGGGTSSTADPSSTASSTADSSSAAESTAPSDESGEAPASDREIITITINAADEGVSFDPANDAVAAEIYERFGIQFVPQNIQLTDGNEYTLLAASGDLPDVMYAEPLYYLDQFNSFVDQGYIREIPQEMIDKFPNVKNIIETSDSCAVDLEIHGGHYMLPKPDSMDRSLYIAERRGIFYRKDWAEKFGITEAPTNTEELYTMLKHFTEDDPDGNGAKDTWGLSAAKAGELRIWFIAWGVDNQNWVKAEDGTWTHGQLTPNNIEPLEFFRQMYKEGILDPEFAQVDYKQTQQKLAGGTVGAITRNADTDWINGVIVEQFGAANPDKDPFETIGLIPILSKDAASEPLMHKYLLDMTATEFSADCTDEQLERYLEFHDWAMTDEGVGFKLGIEGQDWEKSADGHYVIIPTADGSNPVPANLYPSVGLLNMPSWGFELHSNYNWPIEKYGQYADEVRDLSAWAREQRNPYAYPNNMNIKMISSPSKLEADAFNFSNAVAEIIMGDAPVEDMFNDMVQKAMDTGFREAIEDVNAYAQEHGIE